MNVTHRINELIEQGVPVGEAIAMAIQEKAASVAATEAYAHGGAR